MHEADIILLETRNLLRSVFFSFISNRERRGKFYIVVVNLDKLFWLLKKEIAVKCLKREIVSLACESLRIIFVRY